MSRNTKIILGVGAGLLLMCMCVGSIGAFALAQYARGTISRQGTVQQAVESAVRIEPISAPELVFTVPANWRNQFKFHAFGISMIGLTSASGRGHIFLMQLPPDRPGSQEELRQALDGMDGSDWQGYRNGMRWNNVGRTDLTIAGQQVPMTISEGTSHDGSVYRQVLGTLQREGAQVLVAFEQPVKEWDQQALESLAASIR